MDCNDAEKNNTVNTQNYTQGHQIRDLLHTWILAFKEYVQPQHFWTIRHSVGPSIKVSLPD